MEFRLLREEAWWANTQLPRAGLLTMHSGNASGIHREPGIIIKPSGVDYDRLRPEDLVPVDLSGAVVLAGRVHDGISTMLRPGVDPPHHRLLYAGDPRLGGVIHPRSNNATVWAVLGRSLPCALTAMADEFGGDVPGAPYLDNESESEHFADGIIRHRNWAPAILLANHGVFTFDTTVRKAPKAAVMVEDAARTFVAGRPARRASRPAD